MKTLHIISMGKSITEDSKKARDSPWLSLYYASFNPSNNKTRAGDASVP